MFTLIVYMLKSVCNRMMCVCQLIIKTTYLRDRVQAINLTLYEYSESLTTTSSRDSSTSSLRHSGAVARRPASSKSACGGATRRYAVVRERSNPVDASLCAAAAAGDEHLSDHVTGRHVFTSVSYVVELRVVARKTRDTASRTAFLIRYQGPPSCTARISLLQQVRKIYKPYFEVVLCCLKNVTVSLSVFIFNLVTFYIRTYV